MADSPLTTEEFHDKLIELVAGIASRAIQFDGNGFTWEEAEKVINLTKRMMVPESWPAAEADEYALYVAFSDADSELSDPYLEVKEPLSKVIIKANELFGVEGVREYRDYVAQSLRLVDEWIASQPQ